MKNISVIGESKMKKNITYLLLILTTIFMFGCTDAADEPITVGEADQQEITTVEENKTIEAEANTSVAEEEPDIEETPTEINNELFPGYNLIEVDGGNLSGHREPNVVVDIGFGDRQYWAFT